MEIISSREALQENITRLHAYLRGAAIDREFAREIIERGICFVVTEVDQKSFFAPSRFIGYVNNTRDGHLRNPTKDGRVTNKAIEELLSSEPVPSKKLEDDYERFCIDIGGRAKPTPFARRRKFWDLRK